VFFYVGTPPDLKIEPLAKPNNKNFDKPFADQLFVQNRSIGS
jgi:hypothetical protein